MDIKLVREASGLSQLEVACRTGISRYRLFLAERHALQLSREELRAIGDVLRPELAKLVRIASDCEALGTVTTPLAARAARK